MKARSSTPCVVPSGMRGLNQARSRFPHPRSAARIASGSRRCRVATLPHQAAALGGGRSQPRFLQTAPEGTTPAWSRRASFEGMNEGTEHVWLSHYCESESVRVSTWPTRAFRTLSLSQSPGNRR